MRKIALLSVCSVLAFSATAQNSSFLEFQPSIATVSGAKPTLQINYGILHHIDSQLKWGAGIGIAESSEFNMAPSLPIFSRVEFDFTDKGNYRPFLGLDLGYSVNFEDFEYGSFFVNPTLGVSLYKCYLGIGYLGSMGTYTEAQWSNAINLRFGRRLGGKEGRAIMNFFKRTTLGIHALYGNGVPNKISNDYSEASNLTRWGYGLSWMYNFNAHWALGVYATYIQKYSYETNDVNEDEVEGDGIEAFVRLQYTMKQFGNLPLKPFANINCGYVDKGDGCMGVAGQVGVKIFDRFNVGATYLYVPQFYHSLDAGSLNFVIGVEI